MDLIGIVMIGALVYVPVSAFMWMRKQVAEVDAQSGRPALSAGGQVAQFLFVLGVFRAIGYLILAAIGLMLGYVFMAWAMHGFGEFTMAGYV